MIRLLNIDNFEFMKDCEDKSFDLGIIDPQTGQGEGKNHASRDLRIKQKNGNTLSAKRRLYEVSEWDNEPPRYSFWEQFFRVTKHQIIMCENRLAFPQKDSSPGRIVWNQLRENDFSACQIMWTDLVQTIDYFEYMWSGMMQGEAINSRRQHGDKRKNEQRIHPSQKPVIVYRHLLKNYAERGWNILDTHLGSGSIAIACEIEGFDFTGTEKEKKIFDDAENRYMNFHSQQTLQL